MPRPCKLLSAFAFEHAGTQTAIGQQLDGSRRAATAMSLSTSTALLPVPASLVAMEPSLAASQSLPNMWADRLAKAAGAELRPRGELMPALDGGVSLILQPGMPLLETHSPKGGMSLG